MIIEIPQEVMFYWPYAATAVLPLALWITLGWTVRRFRGWRVRRRAQQGITDRGDLAKTYEVYRVDEDGTILSIWRLDDASIALGVEREERAKGVHGRFYHNKQIVRTW